MTIENRKTKKRFDISKEEWDNVFVAKALDYKYNIVNESLPVEIKRMRQVVELKPLKNKKNE